MGNRAVITWSKAKAVADSKDLGIYLHWNGGRDSVQPFVEYCKLKKYDSRNGIAILSKIIQNTLGSGTTVNVNACRNLDCDNWDNGVYILKDWEIVGRQYFFKSEQNEYKKVDVLLWIDENQPEGERLGEEFIKAAAEELEKNAAVDDQLMFI